MLLEEKTEAATMTKPGPSTSRVRQLKQAYMEKKPNICLERSIVVTDSFRRTEAMPPVLRQALAFEAVLTEMPIWIGGGELIVANIASRPRGIFLFPEYDDTWLGRELDTISTRAVDPWLISQEDRVRWLECSTYWQGRNFAAMVNASTPEEVRIGEKNAYLDYSMGKEGGVGHMAPDIESVIHKGLQAFVEAAEEHIESLDLANPQDLEKLPFLKAVVIADKAVIRWAARFAALAREKAAAEQDPIRKRELLEIAEICEWVPAYPARSFREALQAVALIMASVQIECNGVSIGTGRLDQYSYSLCKKDLQTGALTEAQALELLECLWLKLAESNRVVSARATGKHNGYPFWVQVPIGGQTSDGYDATNELSYMLLDVSSNMRLHEPTVSARIHKRTPDRFLMKCCEAITKHGGGHPALFNDEVIIPSQLAYVPGLTKEDAYDYSIIGCSEVAFAGKGTEGLAYHAVSLGRLLEMMIQGKNIFTGEPLASGILSWKDFSDVMAAYEEQARNFSRLMFMQVLPVIEAQNMYRPCPYMSSLTRDCIKRGKSFYDGGAIYGNWTANACIVGIGSLANSLAAIKKVVFDEKAVSVAELKHALDTNFEDLSTQPTGPEIRTMCLCAPKYGNDDPYVDNMAKNCLNILVKALRKHQTRPGQGYGATISPVAAHIIAGQRCGATPDGRKAGTPLSDACSPAQSSDVNGPTATVKSVATLEHINLVQGTIFNMRMHPASLETKAGRLGWMDLVRTYFDLGGWEIQFNVVSGDTLIKAQQHPEQYRDLVVRVVGYSAFFVDLDKAVQDDIISRTEHGFH
jgi:pyruvate formate-lyase/glycerol dehydratase family glycyl radical enzyme